MQESQQVVRAEKELCGVVVGRGDKAEAKGRKEPAMGMGNETCW